MSAKKQKMSDHLNPSQSDQPSPPMDSKDAEERLLPISASAYQRVLESFQNCEKSFKEQYWSKYQEEAAGTMHTILFDKPRDFENGFFYGDGLGLPSVGADDIDIIKIFASGDTMGDFSTSSERHWYMVVEMRLAKDKSLYVIEGDLIDEHGDSSCYSVLLGREMSPVLVQTEQVIDEDGPWLDYSTSKLAQASKHTLTDEDCKNILQALKGLEDKIVVDEEHYDMGRSD